MRHSILPPDIEGEARQACATSFAALDAARMKLGDLIKTHTKLIQVDDIAPCMRA